MRIRHAPASILTLLLLTGCNNGTFLVQKIQEQIASSAASSDASSVIASSAASSAAVMSEDEATIREFYRAIAAHEFQAAYDLYSVKKVGFSTFQGWYATVKTADVSDIKEAEPHVYTFMVTLTEDNDVTGLFDVRMRVADGKLETVSSTQRAEVTHANDQLGISFSYPSSWPAPTILTGDEGANNSVRWKIDFGNICKGCREGSDTRYFNISGYDASYGNELENTLRQDEFVTIVREFTIDGHKAIEYTSGDMCGYRNALIFGDQYVYKLGGFCLDDWEDRRDEFVRILASFKVL